MNKHIDDNRRLDVFVRRVRLEADGIKLFQIGSLSGAPLPEFTAGSHIEVQIDAGMSRQYSLCSDPNELASYEFAVQLEPSGRGGSRAMHERVIAGVRLNISRPRNFFGLQPDAHRHLLLAGGIGVTPMMSMIYELERKEAEFQLHYCTRSPERSAFLNRLAPLIARGNVIVHHDGGDATRGLTIETLIANQPSSTHLYYCGPAGFMKAIATATSHWPSERKHREFFAAPVNPQGSSLENRPFQVKITSSGRIFDVPADRSIIDVLQENGVTVASSCRTGYCGSCLTRYVAGKPEHRDTVLDDRDHKEFVLVCCARAESKILVLDL